MTWTQTYTPVFGSLGLSAVVGAVPVVMLLGLLALRVRAHLAALSALAASLAVAIVAYRMPSGLAFLAAIDGAAYGFFPIGWIVLCAIFVYDITVHTGQFEVVKTSVAGLAGDRRIQTLLIAFSFGAFIEGAAGFGTPVAISAAMMIGLGFRPREAAVLALIGNTAPVAYGALGTPILVLASVTGLPLGALSCAVGRILPFFSLLIPFWLICTMAGFRGMLEVWPACLTSGLSFALTQFLVSNYHGPWVVDVAGSIVSMAAIVMLLRFWQPRSTWLFTHERDNGESALAPDEDMQPPSESGALSPWAAKEETGTRSDARKVAVPTLSRTEVFRAWMPWILLSVFVFIWGLPFAKRLFNGLPGVTVFKYVVPVLDKAVLHMPPVVPKPTPEPAVFTFNWLSATGTSLFLCGLLSGTLLGLRPFEIVRVFLTTLKRVRFSLLTIAAMLALGFTTRYAGLDATMGLALASTGVLFPFFSPLLGWMGVALTGSDTSSNVLFGNLQQITARQVQISPVLAAAANSTGGVMGKMIDAQSIVVAGVATGQEGNEGQILRKVFFHSLALATLVGIAILLLAYVFTGIVPVVGK